MPDKLSFSKTFQALEKSIAISQRRHDLIASNISNVDTPGYRAKDVEFQSALAQALESDHQLDLATTNPRHIDLGMNSAQRIDSVEDKGAWNGYNWVNIDKEMNRLAENNLIYRTSVETLLRRIAILKEVIREGGR